MRTILSVAVGAGARPVASADAKKPNVLFIAVDDLRPALGVLRRPAREDAEHRRARAPAGPCSRGRTASRRCAARRGRRS